MCLILTNVDRTLNSDCFQVCVVFPRDGVISSKYLGEMQVRMERLNIQMMIAVLVAVPTSVAQLIIEGATLLKEGENHAELSFEYFLVRSTSVPLISMPQQFDDVSSLISF